MYHPDNITLMRNPQKGWSDCPHSTAEETLREEHGCLLGKGRCLLKSVAALGRVLKLQGGPSCRGGVLLLCPLSHVKGLTNNLTSTA